MQHQHVSTALDTYYRRLTLQSYSMGSAISFGNHVVRSEMHPNDPTGRNIASAGSSFIYRFQIRMPKLRKMRAVRTPEYGWRRDLGQIWPVANTHADRVSTWKGARIGDRRDADLITPHGEEPPTVMDVSLTDPKYRSVTRVRPTLVITRKTMRVIKGEFASVAMRYRPPPQTAFAPIPTANRFGTNLV